MVVEDAHYFAEAVTGSVCPPFPAVVVAVAVAVVVVVDRVQFVAAFLSLVGMRR